MRSNRLGTLVCFMLCCVIVIIPDSKATKFFQVSTGIGTISPDKLIIFAAVAITVLALMTSKLKLKINRTFSTMYLYFAWVFITALISLMASNSLFELNMIVFKVVMNMLVFVIVFLFASYDERFITKFINTFLFLSVLNAVFAIAQFIKKSPLFMDGYFLVERGFYLGNGDRLTRVWGFQGEPLALATISMAGLLLMSWKLYDMRNKSFKTKFKYIVGFILLLISLFVSFSRGSIFITAICLPLFLYFNKVKIFTAKRFMLSIFTVPFVLWYMNKKQMFDVIWTRLGRTDDMSYTHRWSVISSVGQVFDQYGWKAVLGLAPGSSNGLRSQIGVMDNNYVNLMLEGGFIGFALFLILLLFCLKVKGNSYVFPLKLVLFGLMLNMFTYELTYYSSTGVLFWVVLGLLSSQYKKRTIEIQTLQPVLSNQRYPYLNKSTT